MEETRVQDLQTIKGLWQKHKDGINTRMEEQDFKLKKVELFETMLESFQKTLNVFEERFQEQNNKTEAFISKSLNEFRE